MQVKLKEQILVFIVEKKNILCAEKISHIIEKPTNKWMAKDIALDADNLC